MQEPSPNLEVIIICTKEPFPESQRARVHTILAMYGYSTLYERDVIQEDNTNTPDLSQFPHHLELVVQNLHANIAEKYGVCFNLNIIKAAKGLTRKLRGIELRISSAQSIEEHAKFIQDMEISTLSELQETARKNMFNFLPPYPIVETISNENSRTRVDKVRYKDGIAVCKTFRSTNLEGFNREIGARAAIAERIPEISQILESGENYFIMPIYESVWQWQEGRFGLFPLTYAEKCIDIVRRINAEQWALLDWHPGNFIYGPDNQVILIDLEAASRQAQASDFKTCPDIIGHANFPYQGKVINYVNTWQPLIGLPLETLLHGSTLKKSLRRAVYLIVKAVPRWATKKGEQKLRWLYRRFFKKQELYKHGSYFVFRF